MLKQIDNERLPRRPTRRERNKAERLARIIDAARRVFRAKGYDGAALKEIADEADTATATLFTYARDKRDLLMMVINTDLDVLTEDSFASIPSHAPLVDQLMYLFEARFRYWSIDIDLARNIVYQAIEDDRSRETQRYNARRDRMGMGIAELIRQHQRLGTLDPTVNADLLARLIFDLYLGENRRWLGLKEPSVDNAVVQLRAVIELALSLIAKRTVWTSRPRAVRR